MSTLNSTVSIDRINELLNYNPDTGVFTWTVKSGKRLAGRVAGEADGSGYRRIKIDGKRFRSHRLAWAMANCQWPDLDIDHINGVRDDNKLINLRLATKSGNCQNLRGPMSNNKHGFLGVKKNGNRWNASINIDKRYVYLGCFKTPELAHEEYLRAKRHIHEFCTI